MPGPERNVYRTELDPVEFLRHAAAVYPTKVGLLHEDGRRYTYAQLAERAWRLGSALRRAGLDHGDRVATLCPNNPAVLEAHYGVPAVGLVLVTVNTRLSSGEIGVILSHSGARALLVDAELEHLLEPLDLGGVLLIRVDDSGLPDDPYEMLLCEGSPEEPARWLEDEEETISINYTSGTTGRPKGVQYSYRGAYLQALGNAISLRLGPDSVFLWTSPMFHCNGWCNPWSVTAAGGRHLTVRRVDPTQMWELVETARVTHYGGAPTVQLSFVNHPAAGRVERGLTTMVGGAPPSPTLFARMDDLNISIVHIYGLTETYAPTTVTPVQEHWAELPPDERARLASRQGQSHVVADLVRVVDEEMRDVPRDGETMGEVVMRGNIVMSGYHDDPEATKEAFRGGWFHSGDLAVWHPDGMVEIRDRSKDIIISGAENISTIEVEQTLAAHPAVLEAAVIAIPHDTWGERPKAFVTLRDSGDVTVEELIAFCRERIAHFKCPDTVEFGPLPKTSTGKVQKYVLREKEWAGRASRVS
jgi:fatty-acyl-CoA synthase